MWIIFYIEGKKDNKLKRKERKQMEKNKNSMTYKGYKPNGKILAAFAVILLLAAAFITYEVVCVYNTQPLPLDLKIQSFFFSLRGDIQNVPICAMTHLTDTVSVVGYCVVLLILPSRKKYGVPLTAASIAGVAIYKPLKHIALRARPDKALHLVEQGGYSFPSGHSVTSVLFYGLAIYLLHKHCKNEKLRKLMTAVCAFLFVFTGPSRIYVGVHWPTDVLAGWCVGGAVLIFSILILEKIYEKRLR